MENDHESQGKVTDTLQGTADLIVQASDNDRTPGEQAAHEEADRRVRRAAVAAAKGYAGDARALLVSAAEWRALAEKARAEDLAARGAG